VECSIIHRRHHVPIFTGDNKCEEELTRCNKTICSRILQEVNLEEKELPFKIVLVPKHAMGRVIGRGGRMVEALAEPNGCKLQFFRKDETEKGETPLMISSLRGNVVDVENVLHEVNLIVSINSVKFCSMFLSSS